MQKRTFLAGLIVGIVAALFCFMMIGLLQPKTAEAQSRVKWEYNIFTGKGPERIIYPADLDALGKDGWEATTTYGNGIVFKRRK